MFFLPPLPPLLLLDVNIVDTDCTSVAIILRSDAISIEIMVVDPLSVALAWVSLEKAFRSLVIAAARSANASAVLVCYAVAGGVGNSAVDMIYDLIVTTVGGCGYLGLYLLMCS